MARPRRSVSRRLWAPFVPIPVRQELSAQAASADLPFGTYVELAVSRLFDYRGPYLPEHPDRLPTPVPLDELRERAARITRADLHRQNGMVPAQFRIDAPVAEQVEQRCAELDCRYSDYMRAVLGVVAGVDRFATLPLEGEEYDLEEQPLAS